MKEALTAYFVPEEFDVTFNLSHAGGGIISVDNIELGSLPQTLTFTYGQTSNVTIELDDNYILTHWSSTNEIINDPNSESIDITVEYPDTIIAHLNELFKLSFIIEPVDAGIVLGNGNELEAIPLSQTFIENTVIDLQAIPVNGMKFDYWTRENAILEQNNIYHYTLEHNDTLRVVFSEEELAIYIPNSFTPNGDMINDVFKAIGDSDKVKSYQMSIFNEWGEFVFETNDIEEGWDAKNIDTIANNVFIYKIVVFSKLTGSKYEYVGTVMVL